MKKIFCLLIAVLALVSLAACGETPDNNGETDEPTSDTPQITVEQHVRDGMYKMIYNTTLFKLEEREDGDSYTYTGQSDANLYVSVTCYTDMSADDVLHGLLLQNGLGEYDYEDCLLGPENALAYYIPVLKDDYHQCFFVVSHGAGALLLEVGGYDLDMEGASESPIDLMVQSFIPIDTD